MAAFSSDTLILKSADAANSLPDPTTAPQRTLWLVNTGAATATWSSIGATPFTDANGANVATVTVAPGSTLDIQSNGTRWVVKPDPSLRRVVTATGVTNASGQVTVAFSPAFAASPVIAATVQTGANTNGSWAEIRALSASSVTIQVWSGRGVLVGGQTTTEAGSGFTVHVTATGA